MKPAEGEACMDTNAEKPSVDSALAEPRAACESKAVNEPVVAAEPVAQGERISSVDVLRGFALLGILVMNIGDYALPGNFDYNPTILGPLSQLNLFLWAGRFVLFEGKMRALFSMLFGAGVILLTSRLEKRGDADIAGDIFTRRNMWLTLFGVLHAYFLWWGDILYFYGMTALLFLYPCRKLKARTLLIAGMVVVLGGVGYRISRLESRTELAQRAEAANRAQAAGQTLTEQQKNDVQEWEKVLERAHPSREELDKEIAALRGGYGSVFRHNAEQVVDEQGSGYYRFGFFDSLGMMLLGMGLLRLGFLSGQLTNRVYVGIALTGYGIGLPLGALCMWKEWENGFHPLAILRWEFLPYDILRILVGLAHASVVLLIVKAGALKWITRPLAAVGQTALSNYLGTTVICTLFFYGWGFGMFGKLPFYQLFYVVAGIWVVNLVSSTMWLKYFRFGPLEWVWRSLTYWRVQPLRRTRQDMRAIAAPAEV
jgi:uncharacterized protein